MSERAHLGEVAQRRLWRVVEALRSAAMDAIAPEDRDCYFCCAADVEARILANSPPGRPLRPKKRRLVIPWESQPLGKVSDRVIAERLGVSQSVVNCERRRRGIPAARANAEDQTERNAEIVRRVKAGETLTEIGHGLGVTRERIRQIAAKGGATAGRSCATPGCPNRVRRHERCTGCRAAAAAAERAARPPREKRCVCTCGQCPPGKRRCYYRKRYGERPEVRERHAKATKRYIERLRAEGGERWERHVKKQKAASHRHAAKKRAGRPPAKKRAPAVPYMERYRTDPAFRARELARSREKYRRWREKVGVAPRKKHPGWSEATKEKMRQSARQLWHGMTPEERADRLRRMQAGRQQRLSFYKEMNDEA